MIRNKKGFSLLELILVLGIASAVSFMKFQDLKNDQENILANAVGVQIKQIGTAVNGYINIHYDKLSTLTSISSGNGTDPGPRTCSTTTNTCTITYQTLVNDGLLPSSFTGINANKSPYSIVLKREGTSPNYIINGLVTTNNAWIEGVKVRYDLLGKAMQAAGIDSGVTKTTSIVSGYSGAWSENSTDYSNINKVGSLGYRVGYDSAMYSVYLRRDGMLPMTGDLNLDGHNINNVAALNVTGNITTTGDLQARNIKASGNIESSKNVKGATLESTGRVTVGEFVQLNGQAEVGKECQSNGLQGRTADGQILSCVNAVWNFSGEQPGTIKMWGTSNAPVGWLELNGQAFDKSKNPTLATLYPSGVVPDIRGQFVRAWDHGAGVDSDSSRGILSTQGDAIRNISGYVSGIGGVRFDTYTGAFYDSGSRNGINAQITGACSSNCNDDFAFDASRQVPTAPENRPKNVALMYIIKKG